MAGKFDACNAPYTLTIIADNVNVQSGYGDPFDNDYGSASKSYTIKVNDYKLCFARPNQMKTSPDTVWMGWDGSSWQWNQGSSNPEASGGNGGYSPDFDPENGFKVSASTKFPNTGFPGAQFDLLMSNEQTDYTYQSSQPDEINIDPTGTVKFISKPSGTVTITATPKAQGFPAVTYQFNPTSTWAIPQSGNGSWAISQSKCGVGNVLNRKELTNSPRNTAPMGWSYVANYYTRAIGGGIFGEWGTADKISYPNSQWNGILFWVDEVHTTNSRQYLVNHSNGLVTWAGLAYAGYVACRG